MKMSSSVTRNRGSGHQRPKPMTSSKCNASREGWGMSCAYFTEFASFANFIEIRKGGGVSSPMSKSK